MGDIAMNKVTVLPTGGRLASITPQSFEDVQRIAKMAVAAGLTPKGRKDTDDQLVAKAIMAIMQGLECGVPPIQALQHIAMINGRAVMYGDLLTALLWSKGFKVRKWVDGVGEARIAHAEIIRPDGTVIAKTFSVAQARKAKLWDERATVKKQWDGKLEEKPNDSPWYKFDERMLEWRAFGFAVKDGAADATHGMMVREEIEHNDMVDITPEKPSREPTKALDLPDIPDVAPIEVDPPIQDADGYIDHLVGQLATCESAAELAEIAEHNETMILRLPAEHQKRARDMIEEAGRS